MQTIKTKNLTWVEIKRPTKDDLAKLNKMFKLHPLVLGELLPPLDYPKIENFGDYLFIVLFYPFFDRKTSQTIPFELDIIVSSDYIITSHYKDIVPLKAVFDKCNLYEEQRNEYLRDGTGQLLCQIIQDLFKACFPKLSHIKENIDKIEEAIYRTEYRETVNKISLAERDIIGFEQIIEPQGLVLRNLSREARLFFSKKTLPYFHSLINLYNLTDNILKTRHKTLTALTATNQSLLTNRTNEIIKLLTIFSVVILPLTLVASIFSMNTAFLPFVGTRGDFWLILAIMLAAALVMIEFFRRKKWI